MWSPSCSSLRIGVRLIGIQYDDVDSLVELPSISARKAAPKTVGVLNWPNDQNVAIATFSCIIYSRTKQVDAGSIREISSRSHVLREA